MSLEMNFKIYLQLEGMNVDCEVMGATFHDVLLAIEAAKELGFKPRSSYSRHAQTARDYHGVIVKIAESQKEFNGKKMKEVTIQPIDGGEVEVVTVFKSDHLRRGDKVHRKTNEKGYPQIDLTDEEDEQLPF